MNEEALSQVLERMADLPEFMGKALINGSVVGNFGNVPLHVAAGWGDVQAIVELVKNGTDVNVKGEEGLTPLHRAAAAGHLSAVASLLDLGADPLVCDCAGQTALDLAVILNQKDVATLIAQKKETGGRKLSSGSES